MRRWWIYQRERFPLAAHVPLVAAFSASAVCFSSLTRGAAARPSIAALLVAFATSLLFFLQLRIADEFKDKATDAQFRPYRPVPRGLVSLRELAEVAVGGAGVQFGLALWLDPRLVWLLVAAWTFLGLMTREFFVGPWLQSRPLVYMTSHMVILPIVDFYATACDWLVAGEGRPPAGLGWFLAVSYLNGVVIEIGRKTRGADDEERGVETYSAMWGAESAVRVWLAAVLLTGAAAYAASHAIGTPVPVLALLTALGGGCVLTARRFAADRQPGSGLRLERMSAVWTLLLYLGLGAAPLAARLWAGPS